MKYELNRFIRAQSDTYETALSELRRGRKTSHWIWYIFPQLKGLGFSPTAQFYGIGSLDEARAYLANEILRSRLLELSQVLLELQENDIGKIMGYPDDLKLRSSMTLFQLADPSCNIFQSVLDKFFNGMPDEKTIALCKSELKE